MVCFLFSRRGGEGYAPPRCVFAILTRRGGEYPSSLCCSHSNTARRGMPPPRRVIPVLATRRGGACPSPSCLCFIFDTSGRGMPLLVAFSLFRRDEEGYTLLVVLFLFQHGEEGHAPPRRVFISSLTHRGGAYLPCRVFPISTRRGRACPLLVVFLLYFRRVGEGYALSRCVIAFQCNREGHSPPRRVIPISTR